MHFLESGLHKVTQRIHGNAQHLAVVFRGDNRHIKYPRGLREFVRGMQHGFVIVNGGHQPALHIDDE
ncbi:hypothetical protein D3C72_2178140 [compost metagenome]